MRRYLILAFLFCLTLPFDLAITGCYRNPDANFCNNLGYGAKNTTIASITLLPNTSGLSLPYGETGATNTPTAKSCASSSVSVSAYSWGTTDLTLADINPTTGAICAGTWNRNTAGGVAAFTTCLPTNKTGVAYITASAGNITSNTVAVYVHPAIANVTLSETPSSTSSGLNGTCISQGQTAQLNITAYAAGSSTPLCAPNSTTQPDCSTVLGHLTYAPVTATIATIDYTGLATANQPGSTAITATTNSGNTSGGTTTSSAGYFYTCPAASITLTANGATTANVTPNNPQAITATVKDTNGVTITGLALTYASTQPENVPISAAGTITSVFPKYGLGYGALPATHVQSCAHQQDRHQRQRRPHCQQSPADQCLRHQFHHPVHGQPAVAVFFGHRLHHRRRHHAYQAPVCTQFTGSESNRPRLSSLAAIEN